METVRKLTNMEVSLRWSTVYRENIAKKKIKIIFLFLFTFRKFTLMLKF